MDASQIDELQKVMSDYPGYAGQAIDEILHGSGEKEIETKIYQLLPVSGRKWSGKKTAAKSAKPFTHEDENLAVTVVSRGTYHYLYFPDDGSNTKRHAGGQEFMRRGAEAASDKIVNLCVGKLTEGF
jgi:hypothetical protein